MSSSNVTTTATTITARDHIECTPLCTFRHIPRTNHYQCSTSKRIHVCTDDKCTYQFQLDVEPSKETHHTEQWHCPLSKQFFRRRKRQLQQQGVGLSLDLAASSSSSITLDHHGNPKKRKLIPVEELHFNVLSYVDRLNHPIHYKNERIESMYTLYYRTSPMIESILYGILDGCKILDPISISEFGQIADICTNIYLRMHRTDWFNRQENKVIRERYSLFYHVLMVLYNMKKKDGLSIPKYAFDIKQMKPSEIPREQVIPSHDKIRMYLPNEKTLRQLFSRIQVTQTTTVSNQVFRPDRTKKKQPYTSSALSLSSSTSSSSSSSATPIATPVQIGASIQPIDTHQFATARHFFHHSLIESVRHPKEE